MICLYLLVAPSHRVMFSLIKVQKWSWRVQEPRPLFFCASGSPPHHREEKQEGGRKWNDNEHLCWGNFLKHAPPLFFAFFKQQWFIVNCFHALKKIRQIPKCKSLQVALLWLCIRFSEPFLLACLASHFLFFTFNQSLCGGSQTNGLLTSPALSAPAAEEKHFRKLTAASSS